MRTREPPPPVVMLSGYGGDVGSSMSVTEPSSHHPPQHARNYKNLRIPQAGQRTTRKRVLQRSPQLQSALDRIEIRSASPVPRSTKDDVGRDPVDHVQDMFLTYDVVLDHLVRKNRDLKAYVRNQSHHFPSEQSYTSTEVIDALEMLRMERETSLGPHLARRAISQPRPSRMIESIPRDTFYERQHHFSRSRIGSSFTDERRSRTNRGYLPSESEQLDRDLLKRVDFMCDRLTQNKGHKNYVDKRDEGMYDYRRHSRDALQVMNDFKRHDMDQFQIQENLPGERPPFTRRGIRREDPVAHLTRPSIGTYSGRTYRDNRPSRQSFHISERESNLLRRPDDSDPIEILRSREDSGYEPFDLNRREYYPHDKSSFVASEREETQTNSEILSKLLPEKIPPKIKASRERLLHFRNSRLKGKSNNELEHKKMQGMPFRQPPLSSLHRRLDSRPHETLYTMRSRFMNPPAIRSESPESPRDVIDVEAYYRPSEPNQARKNRFVHSTLIDPVEQHRERRLTKDQNEGHDGDSSRDASLTPSEQARQLIAHVNDVYRLSKEMRESNERIEEELSRIKDLYLSRSRALELSTSKDIEKGGTDNVPEGMQNVLTRTESSPQRHVIRPPRFSLDKMKKIVNRKDGTHKKKNKATKQSAVQSDEPSEGVSDGQPGDKGYRPKSPKKRAVVARNVQLYDKSLISCSSGETISHIREENQLSVSIQSSNDNEESDDFDEEPMEVSRAKKVLSGNQIVLPEHRRRGTCCG